MLCIDYNIIDDMIDHSLLVLRYVSIPIVAAHASLEIVEEVVRDLTVHALKSSIRHRVMDGLITEEAMKMIALMIFMGLCNSLPRSINVIGMKPTRNNPYIEMNITMSLNCLLGRVVWDMSEQLFCILMPRIALKKVRENNMPTSNMSTPTKPCKNVDQISDFSSSTNREISESDTAKITDTS